MAVCCCFLFLCWDSCVWLFVVFVSGWLLAAVASLPPRYRDVPAPPYRDAPLIFQFLVSQFCCLMFLFFWFLIFRSLIFNRRWPQEWQQKMKQIPVGLVPGGSGNALNCSILHQLNQPLDGVNNLGAKHSALNVALGAKERRPNIDVTVANNTPLM